jgi:hypothetical protein
LVLFPPLIGAALLCYVVKLVRLRKKRRSGSDVA